MRGDNIQICKECLTPSSRPRVEFNHEGICNACVYSKEKNSIDWEDRQTKLMEILESVKSNSGYHCVVPFSGGKDSASIAYKLKFEYGLNPLLVTFSPLIPNEVGEINRQKFVDLGFDHVMFRANGRVARSLARRFFIERGNPKVAWDAGINATPVTCAIEKAIPVIFYAEHGETEYGGKVLHEESSMIRDFTEVIEHQIGDHPLNWMNSDINETELLPYAYPEANWHQITAYYFAYFHNWSMYNNYEFVKDKYEFMTCPQGRTSGTFTNFDSLDDKIDDLYYYLQYVKFGFGRCVRDASRLIQNNHITREEGLDFVKKYDGEFPSRYLNEVLDYLSLNFGAFMDIIEKHRNEELWVKCNGNWKLRFDYK